MLASGGALWVQAGEAGQGGNTSSGSIRFSGLNSSNLANFSVRYGGADQTIWHAGNDGAGSTLDSDLLDGQHGTYYRDLSNSTGTLPNDRLSGNYSLANLDLSGAVVTSQASFSRYGVHIGRTTTTSADVAGASQAYLGVNSSGVPYLSRKTTVGGSDTSTISLLDDTDTGFRHNNNIVWTAGNDGSGSTLDADLLDGQHGTYYRDLANSTGTLPSARIAGAYTGITNLGMTGTLTIENSAPSIVMSDTTANSYNTRIIVDSNNWYLQKATGSTWTTFMQFEMDTTNAYANGSQIWTQANHLNIGTSASSARSALGLGGLSLLDLNELFYTGTSSTAGHPIGAYVLCYTNGAPVRNETVSPIYTSNGTSRSLHRHIWWNRHCRNLEKSWMVSIQRQ